jgi:hypothetical protein
MKDGRKLLSELSALSSVPVYMRVHCLLVTGVGEAALKWARPTLTPKTLPANRCNCSFLTFKLRDDAIDSVCHIPSV